MSIHIPSSSTNIGTPNDAKKIEKNEKTSTAIAPSKTDTSAAGLRLQDDISTVTSISKAEKKIPNDQFLDNTSEAIEMAEKIKRAINANPYLALDAQGSANESSVNALMSNASS